jgi:hypothetical protein
MAAIVGSRSDSVRILLASPTPLQHRALDLVGAHLAP